MSVAASFLSFLVSVVLAAQPVASTQTASVVDASEGETISFIATENATFDEILDSMLLSNDPDQVIRFLDVQSEAEQPPLEDLALDYLPEDEARVVLEDAADSVASALPEEEVEGSDDPAGEPVSAFDTVPASNSKEPSYASGLYESGTSTIARASVSSAPIKGTPIGSNYSWQYSNRAYVTQCPFIGPCSAPSWLDYRLTTNPGEKTSATIQNYRGGGKHQITSVKLESIVLSAGRNISTEEISWNVPVSGLKQWNFHDSSTKRKTYQAYYKLTFTAPGIGSASMEFKTGKSAACAEPTPGAYRCKFK